MRGFSPALEQLMNALTRLPGIGPKSAQRLAFHLIHKDQGGAGHLAQSIQHAIKTVRHCELCRNLSDHALCAQCQDVSRSNQQLCVVHSPLDVIAIEQANVYRGKYFVLMGQLSPLDGVGPEELGLYRLKQRIISENIDELILATNSTVEGEATAHYISELVKDASVIISRIAYGVPMGGELEYVDGITMQHAFSGRRTVSV
ncbi:MAG: recombination mediator RecR [Pseudomonadota bacterium]